MASWIRFRSRFVAALLVFALTSITVMGCATNGSESSPSSPGTDAGYDSAAKAPEQSSNDVQQRTDLSNEHISSWNRYEVVSDTSVRIFFSMGNPKCHGVRATVDEDSSAVLITLYEGTLPQRANRMRRDRSQCIPSAYHTQSHWNPFRHYWIKIVQTFGTKHIIPPVSPCTCLRPVN